MKCELYQDKQKKWRWQFKSKNGRVIASSLTRSRNKSGALKSAKALFMSVALELNDIMRKHKESKIAK